MGSLRRSSWHERVRVALGLLRWKGERQEEIREEIDAAEETPAAPTSWKPWLGAVLPEYFGGGFAKRHQQFWEWVWSIGPEDAPRPYVAV